MNKVIEYGDNFVVPGSNGTLTIPRLNTLNSDKESAITQAG
jgi:hypothetical protein